MKRIICVYKSLIFIKLQCRLYSSYSGIVLAKCFSCFSDFIVILSAFNCASTS